MDIEWALAGERLFILQARPITALPVPRRVSDWTPPRAGGRYFRSSVIELLPDPLSPLFATMALPCWNASMRSLMAQLVPRVALLGSMNVLVTVNQYAYYEFGLSVWQWLRMIGLMFGRSSAVHWAVRKRAGQRKRVRSTPR
jgi:pyruvate,water dikinase